MTNINFEEMNENMNKMGQFAYNAAKTLYTMSTNTVEQLFDQQIAMATLGMESIASQMKLVSIAKGYQAVIEGQADIANDLSSKSQGIARNTLDILNESKEEVSAWVEEVAKEAVDNNPMVKAA
ncbi:MAG: TIGR01841 family phasin [Gammaproteobacteria bacterium]